MTLKQFVKKHRQDIDRHLKKIFGDLHHMSDKERRFHVTHTQDLSAWARHEGVNIS